MNYPLKNDDGLFIEDKLTPLSESEACYYLREAWKSIFGEYPSKESCALLWAQSALETGRWKLIHNHNWPNIKRIKGNHWTSYKCNEVLNGKVEWFYPYHPQTHFAAYLTSLDGAVAYIKFLSERTRYREAWNEVLKGDPVAFTAALKRGGFFTANLATYTKGVVSLSNEFKRKYSKFLEYKPEGTVTAPEEKEEQEQEQEQEKKVESSITLPSTDLILPEGDYESPKSSIEKSKPLKEKYSILDLIMAFIAAILSFLNKTKK